MVTESYIFVFQPYNNEQVDKKSAGQVQLLSFNLALSNPKLAIYK